MRVTEIKPPVTKPMQNLIYRFDQSYFQRPWSLSAWKSVWESENYRFFLLVDDTTNEVLGFTVFSTSQVETSELLKILIIPEKRKQGLGKLLLEKSLFYLPDFKRSLLEVSTLNKPAISMYKKCNYKIIAHRKRFYSDGADAYTMSHER